MSFSRVPVLFIAKAFVEQPCVCVCVNDAFFRIAHFIILFAKFAHSQVEAGLVLPRGRGTEEGKGTGAGAHHGHIPAPQVRSVASRCVHMCVWRRV